MYIQEAWDSYIQNGGAIDPAFQFLPTHIDQSQLSPDGQNQGQGQGQGQQQSGDPNSNFGNNIFMGANTPR